MGRSVAIEILSDGIILKVLPVPRPSFLSFTFGLEIAVKAHRCYSRWCLRVVKVFMMVSPEWAGKYVVAIWHKLPMVLGGMILRIRPNTSYT